MKSIKVRSLIKKLQKLEEKHGNLEVVVDFETYEEGGHGYYNLEKVTKVENKEAGFSGDFYINLKSSNEM